MSSQEFAASQETDGIMNREESLKWQQISQQVKQHGNISEADLDWLLKTLSHPGPSSDATAIATRHLELILVLKQVKDYLPDQKERVYQATVGYLSSPERNDKLGALTIVRHLKDTRAISKVAPLVSDQDALVRTSAQKTLTVLNNPGQNEANSFR